jgi:hypothetical protein
MRTDGRTDMTMLIVAFCNFSKAPKKKKKYSGYSKVFLIVFDQSPAAP